MAGAPSFVRMCLVDCDGAVTGCKVTRVSSQQSGIVRQIRAQWRMTDHAMERLGDRGVAATELLDLLLARNVDDREFDVDERGKPLYCRWNDHIGVVYVDGIDYDSGDSVKVILSVYLSGQGKANWERDAVDLAGKRRGMQVIKIEDMHEWAIDRTAIPEPKYKAKKKPTVAPVVTSNAFDGMPKHMIATVRKTLREMGLDPDDMRPVRVVGNTIDIDPTRLKRAG